MREAPNLQAEATSLPDVPTTAAAENPGSAAGSRKVSATALIFALLCSNAVVMYIDRTNMAIAAPLIKHAFGLTNVSLGATFSALAIAYASFMVVGGRLGDIIGSRRGLAICGVIWAVGTFLTGLAGSVIGLIVARFLVGAGEAAVYPISSSVIARWIPNDRRGAAQGVLHGCGRLGAAATPLAVTALILAFSWRTAFFILGAASLVVACTIFIYLRDDPRLHSGVTGAELARLGHQKQSVAPGSIAQSTSLDWADFVRRVWPVTAVSFCYGWFSWFLLSWVPLYFVHSHGLNLKHVAMYSSLVLTAGVLGMVCGGFATDGWLKYTGNARRARRDIVVFSFLAAIVCVVPLLFTTNLLADVVFLALGYFMIELADPSIWVLGMEVLPSHTATSTATVNTGFAIAGAVSPLVVGWLLDATNGSWNDVFIVSIVVLLLGPLAAYLAVPVRTIHA